MSGPEQVKDQEKELMILNILAITGCRLSSTGKQKYHVKYAISSMELVQRVLCSVALKRIDTILLLDVLLKSSESPEELIGILNKTGKPVIILPDDNIEGVLKNHSDLLKLHSSEIVNKLYGTDEYSIITLEEDKCEAITCSLDMAGMGLSDMHVHTDFAYCSENVEPGENIRRAEEFGLQKIAFTEHAGQLYVDRKDYWSARFINEPEIIIGNRNTPINRMKNYREKAEKYRSDSVLIGLEVEVDHRGNLALLEEDYDGWDILVGAVHYLPERYEIGSKNGFMWANESLLKKGINTLAHPFRYFIRNGLQVPAELYEPLAELLAQYGAAAELNYHTNDNDPAFFAKCIERNVSIALASDAHNLCEIGSFNRHLELLKSICPPGKLGDILFHSTI